VWKCGRADIQYATIENRRGKEEKKKKKKEETTGVKHNGLPITMGGHYNVKTCRE